MSAADKLTEAELDARIAQIAEPLPPYDVEREFRWFPWACLLAVVAGAFLPPLLS